MIISFRKKLFLLVVFFFFEGELCCKTWQWQLDRGDKEAERVKLSEQV